jgi:serine/threonine protein kinase
MPAPPDCLEFEHWRTLVGDSPSFEDLDRWELHLAACTTCQERLDQTETCGEELKQWCRQFGDPTEAAPDPALVEVRARLHDLKSTPRPEAAEPADLYFLRPSSRPDLLGTLGDYEVQEVIGQGGMGVVLKAFDPGLHRSVAIKVLAAAVAGSVTARRRFTREAQAAAAVCHEHVITVHGVHEVDSLPYLVMQYVPGESLQERLDRSGRLDLVDIVRIGAQAAAGLAAAHAQGLIHRDIKPANLLLENGLARVKLTDFGLARMIDDVGLTQNGVVTGTPEFMAPEQARGEAVDHRADLFSLGSVLFAMAAGAPPFRAETTMGILRRVCEQPARPLRELSPTIPLWLEELVERLMAKAPAERIQSAAEVAALLESYLAHLQQPATVPEPPLPDRRQTRFARRKAWGPILAACLGILLLLGLVFLANPGRDGNLVPQAGMDSSEPRLLHGHTGAVHDVCFLPDGRLVSTSGWPQGDQTLRLWDPATGKELACIPTPGEIHSLALTVDGRTAVVGLNTGTIVFLNLETGQSIRLLHGHTGPVDWVALAPDSKRAFSASIDGTARMWELDSENEPVRFRVEGKWARCGALFSDGARLLTGDNAGLLQIWNLATRQEIRRIDAGPWIVDSLLLLPGNKQVLVAGVHGLRLIDLDTGAEVRRFQGEHEEVYQATLAPDGRLLTAGFDGVVRLWNFESGELMRELGKHPGYAFSVAFSPDGRMAAAGYGGEIREGKFQAGTDHDIRLWKLDPASAPSAPAKLSWLAIAAVILLLMVSCLVGGWYVRGHARRKRQQSAKEASRPADTSPVPASPTLELTCSGCGKALRIRAELAGKKVKCPRCGQILPVDATRSQD